MKIYFELSKDIIFTSCFLFLFIPNFLKAQDISGNISLSDSLVSYWELDEVSGNRTDSKGDNDLVDVNFVGQVSGKQGSAASFASNENKYLYISDSEQVGLDINGSISIALWVRMGDLSQPQIFVHKYN